MYHPERDSKRIKWSEYVGKKRFWEWSAKLPNFISKNHHRKFCTKLNYLKLCATKQIVYKRWI